jgi:hypothetical protein
MPSPLPAIKLEIEESDPKSVDNPDDITNTGLDLIIGDDVDFGRKSSTFFESDSSNSSSTGVGGDGEKPTSCKETDCFVI